MPDRVRLCRSPASLLLGLARRLLGDLAQPGELQTVLRGLPHNVDHRDGPGAVGADRSGSAPIRLGPGASATVDGRADRRVPRRDAAAAAQRGLTRFLRRYGHRAVAEIDLGMPRWSDDPSHILGVLANYLRSRIPAGPGRPVPARRGRGRGDDRRARRARRARSRRAARLVGFACDRARPGRPAGEPEVPADRAALGCCATQLGRSARRWCARRSSTGRRHLLPGPGRGATRAARRDRCGRWSRSAARRTRRAAPPAHPAAAAVRRDRARSAVAGSAERPTARCAAARPPPGTVTGPARVVLDPAGAQLEPGEILVAPSTDPAGRRCS